MSSCYSYRFLELTAIDVYLILYSALRSERVPALSSG